MDKEPEVILDMEERLKEDAQGTYLQETLDSFSLALQQIKKSLTTGLPPDQFQATNKLKDAIEDAASVVQRVWKGLHG